MALSTTSQPIGQQGKTTTPPPGPGACTLDHDSARARFEALSEELKQSILDKHRHWNVEDLDWWDCVYDCFKTEMQEIGLEVDRMYFSGFYSQGDGACFEGYVRDWRPFLQSLGYNCPALINHAVDHFRFSVEHSGHYYHENCTRFSSDLPLPQHDEDQDFIDDYLTHEADSVQAAVVMALLNTHSSSALELEFMEVFKNHMRELYKQLEAEYDYLTSDEAVLDALEANDQLEDAITDAIDGEQ